MRVFLVALLALTVQSCGLLDRPETTPTPETFVPRFASPEEYAVIAADAEANCGKPYFGTFCGNPPHYVQSGQ